MGAPTSGWGTAGLMAYRIGVGAERGLENRTGMGMMKQAGRAATARSQEAQARSQGRALSGVPDESGRVPSAKRGGKVKRTGIIKVHRGERIVPAGKPRRRGKQKRSGRR